MVNEIILLVSAVILIYTYLIFPGLVIMAGRFSKEVVYPNVEEYPTVTVLMSVHNEEIVLAQKLKQLAESDYPRQKLEIIIGSDNSTDSTNSIIADFEQAFENISSVIFNIRQGKPSVINHLVTKAKGEIIIITDADVMIRPDTIKKLITGFSDPATGLLDSVTVRDIASRKGISMQERTYLKFESELKKAEGKVFGMMMGPSGGFYGIRRELYTAVPDNFLVDDFFISLNILLRGKKVMVACSSFVQEMINDDPGMEFRRKIRISTGNFQNLKYFFPLLLRPWKRAFLLFLSHKVLRWAGPLFFIAIFISSCLLIKVSFFYTLLFLIQLIFLLLPPLDIILRRLGINLVPLRFITHFVLMNIALIAGFLNLLLGTKSGSWEPTKRIKTDEQV